MPLNFQKSRWVHGPTENELKKRNNAVRKELNAKGIPRNVVNEEILRRVKVYNMMSTFYPRMYPQKENLSNNVKLEISNFISDGRVFNQRKRKALVELMLRFTAEWSWGERGQVQIFWEILALKNEDVIRYIKYMADFFGVLGLESVYLDLDERDPWAPHFIANLTYKRRRGPIREDPGAVRVLKKRTAFLKEMMKVQKKYNRTVYIRDLPRNIRNKILYLPYASGRFPPHHIWRHMEKEFPLPPHPKTPHPKNAATKIQSVVRGMRNRKKLTTMRKAATTIQKTVRGVSTRKKMKTFLAGRVSLKRKRSPQ